jgi:hypothetical protein
MSFLRDIQSNPQSGNYFDLKKRIIKNVQTASANDRVFEAVHKLFEKSLREENIVLSRPEKNRLLREVLKSVLTDMLKKLDNDQ